jgi:hypothetical protein
MCLPGAKIRRTSFLCVRCPRSIDLSDDRDRNGEIMVFFWQVLKDQTRHFYVTPEGPRGTVRQGFLPFEEARDLVHSKKLQGFAGWWRWSRSEPMLMQVIALCLVTVRLPMITQRQWPESVYA